MNAKDTYSDGILAIDGEGEVQINSDTPWYNRQTPEQRQRDLSILLRSGYMTRHQFELLMDEVVRFCDRLKAKSSILNPA